MRGWFSFSQLCRKKHLKSLATGKIHDAHLCGLFKKDWKKNLPKLKKHLKNKEDSSLASPGAKRARKPRRKSSKLKI